MTKGSIILATGLIALCVGAQGASAKVNKLRLKVRPAYSTAKTVSGTASKKTTVQVTRYKVNYGSAKVRANGKFTVKLKHKLHAGWNYRVTVIQKGYHFKNTYAIYVQAKPVSKPNTQDAVSSVPISSNESVKQQGTTFDRDPDADLNPPETDETPLEVVPNGRVDPDDSASNIETQSGYHLIPSSNDQEYYTSADIPRLKAAVYAYQNKMQSMTPEISETKSHLAALQKDINFIDMMTQLHNAHSPISKGLQDKISQMNVSAVKDDYFKTKQHLANLMFEYNGYQSNMYIRIHQLEELDDLTFSHPVEQ